MNHLKRAWKWLLSFRKTQWVAQDYPLRFRQQSGEGIRVRGEVLKPNPWVVQVIGWWVMAGSGSTRQAALDNLQQSLDTYASEGGLPRPGKTVPIEFAPFEFLARNEDIAREFFPPVIGMNYDDCLITDGSSVWDFPIELSEQQLINKVLLLFHVDISDIAKDANLATIFDRIAAKRGVGQ